MNSPIILTESIHFRTGRRSRREVHTGLPTATPVGRIPRLSKLMALAIRFDGLIRTGDVRDYAELARLGHVTRARITQIMNLLHLAPDIQEALLHLPRVTTGRDPILLRDLQPIAAEPDWRKQRTVWRQLNC